MESALPEAAVPVWKAFEGMAQSKHQYFSYLEALENKYSDGGTRTLVEDARLAGLLHEHDCHVAAFGKAVKALGAQDPGAQKKLIAHMIAYNAALGNDDVNHGSFRTEGP